VPGFTLTLQGKGTTPLQLPTTIIQGLPLNLNGLQKKSVQFRVENPLTEELTINNMVLKVEGNAAPKVNAALRFDTMTIAAGASADNFIDVESSEPIYENETFTISVEWTNG